MLRVFNLILDRTVGEFRLKSVFNKEQIGSHSTQGYQINGEGRQVLSTVNNGEKNG